MKARCTEPVERLARLAREADERFAAILERQSARMQCRAGCSACCRARLSITRVEEAFLRRGLATLSAERRAELAARAGEQGRQNCPALDDDGRCAIYAFRPLICRTYGAPLRRRRPVPLVNPPLLDVCDLNFNGTALRDLPGRDVLDQTEFEERLDEIDRAHRAPRGLAAGRRIPIARILRQADRGARQGTSGRPGVDSARTSERSGRSEPG